MQALRRINNNVVLCRDSSGRELIAMGKGIGFGTFPRELALREIERTFYDTDEKYQQLVAELPEDVLAFSARIVEIAEMNCLIRSARMPHSPWQTTSVLPLNAPGRTSGFECR